MDKKSSVGSKKYLQRGKGKGYFLKIKLKAEADKEKLKMRKSLKNNLQKKNQGLLNFNRKCKLSKNQINHFILPLNKAKMNKKWLTTQKNTYKSQIKKKISTLTTNTILTTWNLSIKIRIRKSNKKCSLKLRTMKMMNLTNKNKVWRINTLVEVFLIFLK